MEAVNSVQVHSKLDRGPLSYETQQNFQQTRSEILTTKVKRNYATFARIRGFLNIIPYTFFLQVQT